MATIAKASEHIKPCNIAQCERHNRRDEDYIKSLDPARIYVRLELTHNNEIYIAPGMEGVEGIGQGKNWQGNAGEGCGV